MNSRPVKIARTASAARPPFLPARVIADIITPEYIKKDVKNKNIDVSETLVLE